MMVSGGRLCEDYTFKIVKIKNLLAIVGTEDSPKLTSEKELVYPPYKWLQRERLQL